MIISDLRGTLEGHFSLDSTIMVKDESGTFAARNFTDSAYVPAHFASLTLGTPLTVANGGTGSSSLTAHALLVGNGASAPLTLAPGTSRNVAISDGTDWASRALVSADIPALSYVGSVSASSPLTSSGGLSPVISIASSTGGGAIVLATSPTIVTPTIASFTNATHNHQNAAGGGTLDAAAIAAGVLAQAQTDYSPTVILTPGTSARNTIAAPTATIIPLTIKTTDDSRTVPAFRIVASDGATIKFSIGGTGVVNMLGSDTIASGASAVWKGISFDAATATITGSTNILTAAGLNYIHIARPTLTSSNALTVTNSATLYVANSPAVTGSTTLTNAYALWVDDGMTRLDGRLIVRQFSGNIAQWQDSSGNALFTWNDLGFIGQGVSPVATQVYQSTASLTPDGATLTRGYNLSLNITPSANNNTSHAALSFTVQKLGSSNLTSATTTVGALNAIAGLVRNNGTGTVTNMYGLNLQIQNLTGSGTVANTYGWYQNAPLAQATMTNIYGIYLEDISVGATLNYAIYTNAGLVHFGDSLDFASGKNITFIAGNVITDTTTGTKIGTATSQKIGLWNTAPNVQPTSAIVAAAFVAGTSGIVDDSATFGGYTIGQIVAALKRIGALA